MKLQHLWPPPCGRPSSAPPIPGQTLTVAEIFSSVQGEGQLTGQPTTFLRLAGCNLACKGCDHASAGGTKLDVDEIVSEVRSHPPRWVCITGGEPLLQNIEPLVRRLKGFDYCIQIKTNGTIIPPPVLFQLIDHWTVTPKCYPIVGSFERITELKYVVNQAFREDQVEAHRATRVYLQPESCRVADVGMAMDTLTRHPDWRLTGRLNEQFNLR